MPFVLEWLSGSCDQYDMGAPVRIAHIPAKATDGEVVLRFLHEASASPTLDALTDHFAEVALAYGFDHFLCAYVASPGRPVQPKVLFGRPHRELVERYREQKLAAHDPTVQYIFASAAPFTWSDMRRDKLTPQQHGVFENAARYGFNDGLVIPVHGAAGDIWAVVLVSRAPITLDREALSAVSAAAILYASTGATLAELKQDEPTSTPLTKRETQCLAWASRGKTDWEIAKLLQIGDKTVNMHIDNARRKLGVGSRSQAALAAWRRGWLLDYPD